MAKKHECPLPALDSGALKFDCFECGEQWRIFTTLAANSVQLSNLPPQSLWVKVDVETQRQLDNFSLQGFEFRWSQHNKTFYVVDSFTGVQVGIVRQSGSRWFFKPKMDLNLGGELVSAVEYVLRQLNSPRNL